MNEIKVARCKAFHIRYPQVWNTLSETERQEMADYVLDTLLKRIEYFREEEECDAEFADALMYGIEDEWLYQYNMKVLS